MRTIKGWSKSKLSLLFIAIAAMIAVPAVAALADNLQDSVTAGNNTKTIATGSANGFENKYWIQETGSGNDIGPGNCDIPSGGSATFKLNVPSGVTATSVDGTNADGSPKLVFNACGTATTNTKSVTFSSNTPGVYNITAEFVSGSTGVSDTADGGFNESPANLTLTVFGVTGVTPADGATGISASTDVMATFSQEMNSSTITGSNFYLVKDGDDPTVPSNRVQAGVSLATTDNASTGVVKNKTAILNPNSDLLPGTKYNATIVGGNSGVKTTTDTGSVALEKNYTWSFTTFAPTPSDTTAPVLTLPSNITEEATSSAGAQVTYTATANDNKDGAVTPTCTPASGSTFALGTTTVNCSATDAAGNKATGSFTVTVQDTTAPSLSLPGNQTAEATGPSGAAVSYGASANDLVDGAIPPICSPASGSTFALGTTTVNCSATDAAGNKATGSFTVTVQDTTAPVIASHGNETAEATGPNGATVSYTSPETTDAVDGTRTASCSPVSGSTFALGTTTVTCNAEDAAGNDATPTTFTVTVQDTTGPVISDVPQNQTLEATGPSGATATWTDPTASDLVDGSQTVTCSPASGSTFPIATTTVECSASDTRGNSSSASFTVEVQDTTAPSLTVPSNISATATSSSGAVVNYTAPSATDTVSGSITPVCTSATTAGLQSGSTFPLGETTITCKAKDAAGNEATKSFKVTVTISWSGVTQPINGGTTMGNLSDDNSSFKQGSTVPVKFKLSGASAGINNATAKLLITKLDGTPDGTAVEDVVSTTPDTGNTFRYDAAGAQYIFNLNTKNLTAGDYLLKIDLGDGTTEKNTVKISLRR